MRRRLHPLRIRTPLLNAALEVPAGREQTKRSLQTAIGNRTSATTNGNTTAYSYQKVGANPLSWQRLLSIGGTSFTYDANGNTATMSGYTFGSDAENRQTSITGGATATYKYDYQGRRTSKTVGTTTSFVYDGLNLVREITTANNDYLYGPGIDEPLAISAAGTVSYYGVDGLGSITELNDGTGMIQNKYAYDTWGSSRSVTQAVSQPFRFTAREVGDSSSQLFYRARFHETNVGRFLSEDPIRLLIERGHVWNDFYHPGRVYTYTDNDPANFVDPLGLMRNAVRHPIDFYRDLHRRRTGGHNRFPGPGNSALRHCVISCESAREWGTGPTRQAGYVNEVQGLILDIRNIGNRLGGGPWGFDPEDLYRNEQGFRCADCPGTCSSCCRSATHQNNGPFLPSTQAPPGPGDNGRRYF